MKPGATTRPIASMTRVPWSGVVDTDLDRPAADADMPHGVEARFGIHDAAVGDDQVVRRGRGRRRAGRGNQECSDRDESVSTGHGRAG